ncbi:MAG: DUF1290 domain-containing protein [Armatimonadota bacterium]
MWLPLLAMVIGFLVVYLPHMRDQVRIPYIYAEYIGIAVVAGIDSVAGAIRAYFEGSFSDRIFVTSFFTNAALAVLLLYLGNSLNIRYVALAIMVALTFRIFNNLGFIRRYLVARLFERRLTAEKTFPEP